MISRWKKEFIENSSAAFESPKRDDSAIEKQKDRYLRKIGDLEMQIIKQVRAKMLMPIDVQKNPTELVQFIYTNQHMLYQEYDVFLSHSSLDVNELLHYLYLTSIINYKFTCSMCTTATI